MSVVQIFTQKWNVGPFKPVENKTFYIKNILKVVYAVVEMLHSVKWIRTVATALPHKNKCVKLGMQMDW